MPIQPPDLSIHDVVLLAVLILGAFFASFAAFWVAWRLRRENPVLSPYSRQPLRRGEDLSYYSMERVLRYLYARNDYYNQIFPFQSAAYCRETGRIFQNCINRFGVMRLDWSFIQQRYPGNFVSWGSLSAEQQAVIREQHASLEGYQTEYSSSEPQPKLVEPSFALRKPGPLYADIDTFVLVGWKIVPDTNLEVLIVQRPRTMDTIHYTIIPEGTQ